MKKLIVSLLFVLNIQSNAQTIILTFSGENIFEQSDLNIDSVYIRNKTNDTDTIVIGNYFSSTVSSIQNRDKNNNEYLTAYPNPFTKDIDIIVQTPNNSTTIITAYSIDGRLIANWSGKLSIGENKFNFKSGVEGIIYLNVKVNDEQFSTKIVCLEKSGQSTIKNSGISFFNPSNQNILKIATLKNNNFNFSYGDTLKMIGYNGSMPSIEINDAPLEDKNYKCIFDLEQYPTKIYKLDSIELNQLMIESPYSINEYGLFKHFGLWYGGYSSLTDTSYIINLSKNTLIQYSKFSNVTSDTSLILKSIRTDPGPIFTHWSVIFKNQFYHGLEILNTQILLSVMDTVKYISGHHFNYVFIPTAGLLPFDTIKEKIIGETIEYYDLSGTIQEKEIAYNSIVDDFKKKIYWFETENYIEFRVVWEIPILFDDNGSDNDIGWYVYVDILSGEILNIWQTFIM